MCAAVVWEILKECPLRVFRAEVSHSEFVVHGVDQSEGESSEVLLYWCLSRRERLESLQCLCLKNVVIMHTMASHACGSIQNLSMWQT